MTRAARTLKDSALSVKLSGGSFVSKKTLSPISMNPWSKISCAIACSM